MDATLLYAMRWSRAAEMVVGAGLTLACVGTADAQACTPALGGSATVTLTGQHFNASLRPLPPSRIEAGKPLRLEVAVCARDGQTPIDRAQIDASMPEHGHGMNYQPSLRAVGAGLYEVDGMLLHMPGSWQISVTLSSGSLRDMLTVRLSVE